MSKLSKRIRINTPAEKVWEVLADFGGVAKWNPVVAHSVAITDANRGVGCERQCEVPGFGDVRERVTEWEEGRRLSYDLEGGAGPMKSLGGEFSLSPAGDNTEVTMTLDFRVKFGPVGALMDRFIVRRQMRKQMALTLAGLKHHVETGEEVGTELPKVARDTAS